MVEISKNEIPAEIKWALEQLRLNVSAEQAPALLKIFFDTADKFSDTGNTFGTWTQAAHNLSSVQYEQYVLRRYQISELPLGTISDAQLHII